MQIVFDKEIPQSGQKMAFRGEEGDPPKDLHACIAASPMDTDTGRMRARPRGGGGQGEVNGRGVERRHM